MKSETGETFLVYFNLPFTHLESTTSTYVRRILLLFCTTFEKENFNVVKKLLHMSKTYFMFYIFCKSV